MILSLLFATLAHAYADGTYSCAEEMTYTVHTVTLSPEVSVPFLSVQSKQSNYKGVATVFTNSDGRERLTLTVGTRVLSFYPDDTSCTKTN